MVSIGTQTTASAATAQRNRRFALTLKVSAGLLTGLLALYSQQHPLVNAKDGSGVFGYKDTPVQPWSGYHVHDPDRPVPKKVDPGETCTQERAGKAPSDAIVLFDGKDLSEWQPSKWKVEKEYVEVTEGSLTTKQEFGSCQLHVEWQTPNPPQGEIMNRGNSGVNLMGIFEIQIFDSYNVKIYPDGQAAAVYGQTPPLVNACRRPGEWQAYDIVFSAPVYKDGKLDRRPRVTLFHNGVLAHYDQEIYGGVAHATLPTALPHGRVKGPLILGGHHNPVRFRNIWLRSL